MSEAKTYYLEMNSLEELSQSSKPAGFELIEAENKEFRVNRFLYQLIGEQWQWQDKLCLSDEEWQEYAESDKVRTWIAYNKGSIAGYYELQKQDAGNVEIVYFGLAPNYIGQGFGGYLLFHALQSAWNWGETTRVWVHTCTDDHDNALRNYQSRGMNVYKTEICL
jgi:GNAT superfamily N-acetyltransferase